MRPARRAWACLRGRLRSASRSWPRRRRAARRRRAPSPSARPAASAPVNVSPAPTASTGPDGRGPAGRPRPGPRRRAAHPLAPSVTTTARLTPGALGAGSEQRAGRLDGPTCRSPAARPSRRPRQRAIAVSSRRFGVRMSARPNTERSMPAAGAGLRIVVEPAARGRAAAPHGPPPSGSRGSTSTTSPGAGREALERCRDVAARERRVGAGRDGDEVLATGIDEDQRDAGRRVHLDETRRGRSPRRSSAARARAPNASRPDRADERDGRAEPRRRDGLVARPCRRRARSTPRR